MKTENKASAHPTWSDRTSDPVRLYWRLLVTLASLDPQLLRRLLKMFMGLYSVIGLKKSLQYGRPEGPTDLKERKQSEAHKSIHKRVNMTWWCQGHVPVSTNGV